MVIVIAYGITRIYVNDTYNVRLMAGRKNSQRGNFQKVNAKFQKVNAKFSKVAAKLSGGICLAAFTVNR